MCGTSKEMNIVFIFPTSSPLPYAIRLHPMQSTLGQNQLKRFLITSIHMYNNHRIKSVVFLDCGKNI